MTRRILPPAEWYRLDATEQLKDAWHYLRPDRDRVIVVEDAQGAIIATWALYYVLHADGLWIDPAHRGKSAAVRHLLRGLKEQTSNGDEWRLWTGAVDTMVDDLLTHFGAEPIPVRHYAVSLPLTRGES